MSNLLLLWHFSVSEEGITSAVTGLQKSINQVNDELKHHESVENDFFKKMSEFVGNAQTQIDTLKEHLKQMQEECQSLAAFYCVDIKKQPIEELFVDVSVFIENFQVSWLLPSISSVGC